MGGMYYGRFLFRRCAQLLRPLPGGRLKPFQQGPVKIADRKSYMSFRLVPKSVTLDDLNGEMALILRYFTELGSFRGALRKSD